MSMSVMVPGVPEPSLEQRLRQCKDEFAKLHTASSLPPRPTLVRDGVTYFSYVDGAGTTLPSASPTVPTTVMDSTCPTSWVAAPDGRVQQTVVQPSPYTLYNAPSPRLASYAAPVVRSIPGSPLVSARNIVPTEAFPTGSWRVPAMPATLPTTVPTGQFVERLVSAPMATMTTTAPLTVLPPSAVATPRSISASPTYIVPDSARSIGARMYAADLQRAKQVEEEAVLDAEVRYLTERRDATLRRAHDDLEHAEQNLAYRERVAAGVERSQSRLGKSPVPEIQQVEQELNHVRRQQETLDALTEQRYLGSPRGSSRGQHFAAPGSPRGQQAAAALFQEPILFAESQGDMAAELMALRQAASEKSESIRALRECLESERNANIVLKEDVRSAKQAHAMDCVELDGYRQGVGESQRLKEQIQTLERQMEKIAIERDHLLGQAANKAIHPSKADGYKEELEANVKHWEGEARDAKTKLAKAEADYKSCLNSQADLKSTVSSLRKSLDDEKSANRRLEGQLLQSKKESRASVSTGTRAEVEKIRQERDRAQSDLASMKRADEQRQQTIKDLRRTLEEERSRITNGDEDSVRTIRRLQESVDQEKDRSSRYQSEIRRQKDELKDANGRYLSLRAEKDQLADDMADLERTRKQLDETVRRLKRQLLDERQNVARLESEQGKLSSSERLKEDLRAAKKERDQAESNAKKLERAVQRKDNAITDLNKALAEKVVGSRSPSVSSEGSGSSSYSGSRVYSSYSYDTTGSDDGSDEAPDTGRKSDSRRKSKSADRRKSESQRKSESRRKSEDRHKSTNRRESKKRGESSKTLSVDATSSVASGKLSVDMMNSAYSGYSLSNVQSYSKAYSDSKAYSEYSKSGYSTSGYSKSGYSEGNSKSGYSGYSGSSKSGSGSYSGSAASDVMVDLTSD